MELTNGIGGIIQEHQVHHHRKFSGVRCLVFFTFIWFDRHRPVYSEVVIRQSTSYSEMARTPPQTVFLHGL